MVLNTKGWIKQNKTTGLFTNMKKRHRTKWHALLITRWGLFLLYYLGSNYFHAHKNNMFTTWKSSAESVSTKMLWRWGGGQGERGRQGERVEIQNRLKQMKGNNNPQLSALCRCCTTFLAWLLQSETISFQPWLLFL